MYQSNVRHSSALRAQRVAVIGLGANGLSAVAALAAHGIEVVGFEQFTIGHRRASSAGKAKIIRYGYEDPFYTQLMAATAPRWAELARISKTTLIEQVGGIYCGSAHKSGLSNFRSSLLAAGCSLRDLEDRRAIAKDFGLAVGSEELAFEEKAAGYLLPNAVLGALALQARTMGATLHENSPVTSISRSSAGVRVRVLGEALDFDQVIVATGPWVTKLVPFMASEVQVSRQYQITFSSSTRLHGGQPYVWIDVDQPFYGFMNLPGGKHVAATHIQTEMTDVDQLIVPEQAHEAANRTSKCLQERLAPGVKIAFHGIRICHYTNTRDEDFIIDRCPDMPEIVILSACSGHGFKFAITSGHYAAELVMTNCQIQPELRFRLSNHK